MSNQKRPKKIIGATVRLKCDIVNQGGTRMLKGELATIVGSWRGYCLEIDDSEADGGVRRISRVERSDVEFVTERGYEK